MASSLTTLYQVLYVSLLGPDVPISAVADIAGHARAANAQRDITGLLVFDGGRFCQQLEGWKKDVLALTERIRQDPRHTGVTILHHGPLAARRFSGFSLAFSAVEDADTLAQLELLDGEAALQAFEAMRDSVLL
ncbi:blue light sensor protein [Acidovorax sp. SRB_14]|uniref:BLUF domain-containing protein n=1 Tax=unclassified Acidovorax TaxID=2684926 RepID=UPI00145E929B|nr:MULTISPECIES: BLUF domain-containing protein [unclassified Acidovorax]NMM77617.1 blue light sensor protein [Acidovorax sp. SRB_24]NMM80242.1 blue light sensor protein [Acidovorax sp. SRB_14]NMM86773.1 blue light sensor protein [Rhodococcus sp. SRB_17]